MTPITSAAITLAALLAEADIAGIPAPYTASATKPCTMSDGKTIGGIGMQVHADELDAWARWLGEPVVNGVTDVANRHEHVYASRDDVPVRVTALVPLAEAVAS